MGSITTFHDLKVWQRTHALVLEVYRLTRSFPNDELYGLISQLRRAAISVASNLVEGFTRRSAADSIHFYNIAASSLEEVKYQLLLARDLGYIDENSFRSANELAAEVGKMLHAWTESQRNNSLSA